MITWKKVAYAAGLSIAGAGGAAICGARRWRRTTCVSLARLAASRLPGGGTYDEAEIEPLPEPVRRYFRAVLRNGQPIVFGIRLVQQGEFRVGEGRWKPMSATQFFGTRRPGFVWDARIRLAPGVTVRVRDQYLSGAGSMRGELFGLVPIIDAHDTPELTAAALQRYLAEAAWFPTALLPRQGVQWTPIDDSSARASLTDGQTAVSLDFRFNAAGEIVAAFTTRYRFEKGGYVPSPWEGRFSAYQERGGMRIPLEAEVEWHLPDRRLPYWRAGITHIEYEYPRETEV